MVIYMRGGQKVLSLTYLNKSEMDEHCLQCFDVVGWAAGKASGL